MRRLIFIRKNVTTISQQIAEKRKARAKWQDKTLYNQLSNEQNIKLKQIRDDSFAENTKNPNRYDNAIWQPIKSSRKPTKKIPPIRTEAPNVEPGVKGNKETEDLFK